jgi:hypothetical protein
MSLVAAIRCLPKDVTAAALGVTRDDRSTRGVGYVLFTAVACVSASHAVEAGARETAFRFGRIHSIRRRRWQPLADDAFVDNKLQFNRMTVCLGTWPVDQRAV